MNPSLNAFCIAFGYAIFNERDAGTYILSLNNNLSIPLNEPVIVCRFFNAQAISIIY